VGHVLACIAIASFGGAVPLLTLVFGWVFYVSHLSVDIQHGEVVIKGRRGVIRKYGEKLPKIKRSLLFTAIGEGKERVTLPFVVLPASSIQKVCKQGGSKEITKGGREANGGAA
jgi:hypothetical protein